MERYYHLSGFNQSLVYLLFNIYFMVACAQFPPRTTQMFVRRRQNMRVMKWHYYKEETSDIASAYDKWLDSCYVFA